jgi:tetratricopeptide (TPR) repeat protein
MTQTDNQTGMQTEVQASQEPTPASLVQAFDLACAQDTRNMLVMTCVSEVGMLQSKAGFLDAAKDALAFLKEEAKSNPIALFAHADVGVALAAELANRDRMSEARAVADDIPSLNQESRCEAYAQMASARRRKDDNETAAKLWERAKEIARNIDDLAGQTTCYLATVKSLAEAGELSDAREIAAMLEADYQDTRGWVPIVVAYSRTNEHEAAEQIIEAKLSGLDFELYQLIETLAKEHELVLGRTALKQFDDPAFAAMACHLMATAAADNGMNRVATLHIQRGWELMDEAKPDTETGGKIFASSVVPIAAVAGIRDGFVICEEIERKFTSRLAAEAYVRLAGQCAQSSPEDAEKALGVAEDLAERVDDPIERSLLFQRVYRIRSSLIGEKEAIHAVGKVRAPVDRAYALLGIAEGQLLDK